MAAALNPQLTAMLAALVARVGNAPQQAATKVINDCLNPEWNETLQLNVPRLDDSLMIECYDSDTFSDAGKSDPKNRQKDDILGVACHSQVAPDGRETWIPGIPLVGLEDGNEKDIATRLVDLTSKNAKDADGGVLMLSLKFMALDQ